MEGSQRPDTRKSVMKAEYERVKVRVKGLDFRVTKMT